MDSRNHHSGDKTRGGDNNRKASNVNWLQNGSDSSVTKRGRTAERQESIRVTLQSQNGIGKIYTQEEGEGDRNFADRVNAERAEASGGSILIQEKLFEINVRRARNPENDGERRFRNLTHIRGISEDFEPEVYTRHKPKY